MPRSLGSPSVCNFASTKSPFAPPCGAIAMLAGPTEAGLPFWVCTMNAMRCGCGDTKRSLEITPGVSALGSVVAVVGALPLLLSSPPHAARTTAPAAPPASARKARREKGSRGTLLLCRREVRVSDRVAFTCNGAAVDVAAPPGTTLLSVLREQLG